MADPFGLTDPLVLRKLYEMAGEPMGPRTFRWVSVYPHDWWERELASFTRAVRLGEIKLSANAAKYYSMEELFEQYVQIEPWGVSKCGTIVL